MKKIAKIIAVSFLTLLITSSLFVTGVHASITYRNTTQHTLGFSSVDSGTIRWGGSTKYELSFGIDKWNELDKVEILPDVWWTVEDVTISDVSRPNETWSARFTWVPVFTDTIQFNTAIMDNRPAATRVAQNRKTVMHELGHALGIGDHYDAEYSSDIMYGYPNTQNALQPHDIEDYHLANP